MSRRVYALRLKINGRELKQVVIDPHYEEKHSASVDDEVIIELVKQLDGGEFQPDEIDESGFRYFVNNDLKFEGKPYKLVWLLHDQETYVGVVNSHRRRI